MTIVKNIYKKLGSIPCIISYTVQCYNDENGSKIVISVPPSGGFFFQTRDDNRTKDIHFHKIFGPFQCITSYTFRW